MSGWGEGALRSPVSGAMLVADSGHSLAAAGERWPVVEGIPFLRADRGELAGEVLAALDRGDGEAGLVALLGDQDGWARTAPPGVADRTRLVREVEGIGFREACGLLGFGAVGDYFAHRWSDPTFLSGLALAEAYWTGGTVFELACGPGHFLGVFGRAGAEVAGGDLVFSKLWLARRYLAAGARLACFDAGRDWPVVERFGTVFCHDAFYFLPEKGVVARECLRVAVRVLVGHAHNRLVDNLSAGAPLSAEEYAGLFGGGVLFDDRELTAALVEARAPGTAEAGDLAGAPAVAVAVGVGAPGVVGGVLAMPPAGTRVLRNPLYVGGRVVWPSERYRREYGPLATYPMEAVGPEEGVAGDPAVEGLVRRRVLVDLPARW